MEGKLVSQGKANTIKQDFSFRNDSAGKEATCNAGDTGNVGLIPGSGGSPGEGNGNPLQHSCLENPRDRGATVQRVAKSWTRLRDGAHSKILKNVLIDQRRNKHK